MHPVTNAMPRLARLLLNFVLAVLAVAVLGSVSQTQFNLAELQQLGVPIPVAVRLTTTGQDLLGFGPVFAVITALVLLLALPPAAVLGRWWPESGAALFAVAGGAGMALALWAMGFVTPMPTLIAASRSLSGFGALVLCAAVGGWVFHWLSLRGGEAASLGGPHGVWHVG